MHTLLEKYFELFWKILCIISKIIGVKSTIKISSHIGKLSSYIFKREGQIALAQLNLPKIKKFIGEKDNEIVTKSFSHIGECVGELLCIDSVFEDVGSGKVKNSVPGISYTDFESTKKLISNGAIALSAHLGCIEFLAAYHVQRGIPLHVVARTPNFSSATQVLEKLRKKYGIVVAWRDDPMSLRVLSKALKDGALVAALIDQDTALESQYSNFFGVEAAYPIAPIMLAIKYKIPVVSSFIYRVRRLKHHIYSEQIHYNADDENAVQKILDIFNARLENMIKYYPEQWIWWHRRWRRQANTEDVPSTKNYIEWLNKISSL